MNVPMEEYEKRIMKGDFDLTLNGWAADYPDPHSIISPLFNETLMQKGLANLSQYRDARMKKLIESLTKEMDKSRRIQKVAEIIRLIDALSLCIPIFQDSTAIIYNNTRIKNIRVTPTDTIQLFNIEKK